jgi:hypothetical protein
LVGVGEAKFSCGHTPSFGDVEEVFTLGDVDGDFTALSAMFFILLAFILEALLDTKSLHGGVEKLGTTFGVEAVATNPNSFGDLCGCGRSRRWWFLHVESEGLWLLLLKGGENWQWDALVGVRWC